MLHPFNIEIPFRCGDKVYAYRPKNIYNTEAYIYYGTVVSMKVEIPRDNIPSVMLEIRDAREDTKYPLLIYQSFPNVYTALDEAMREHPDTEIRL